MFPFCSNCPVINDRKMIDRADCIPGVEVHQFDSFIIAAGGDKVSSRTPGQAVDGALVVFGSLE